MNIAYLTLHILSTLNIIRRRATFCAEHHRSIEYSPITFYDPSDLCITLRMSNINSILVSNMDDHQCDDDLPTKHLTHLMSSFSDAFESIANALTLYPGVRDTFDTRSEIAHLQTAQQLLLERLIVDLQSERVESARIMQDKLLAWLRDCVVLPSGDSHGLVF